MLFAVAAVAKTAIVAAALATSAHTYTVVPGDTLSGIAASHGQSLGSVEAANPQIGNFNLIYAGQQINLSGGGGALTTSSGSGLDGDGDHDGDMSDGPVQSAPAAHTSPSSTTYTPSSSGGVGGGYSSSSLSDIPGVPSSFAACVAQRESSNGTNQAFNGGVYGIITASGINVNGQSLAAQKQAFATLYQKYGTAPWAPSDGC